MIGPTLVMGQLGDHMEDKIQEILDAICKDNYTEEWRKLNFSLIPVTVVNASIGNETGFNALYRLLLRSGYEQINRTKSGGICVKNTQRLYHHRVYDVKEYGAVVEMTISKPVDYRMRSYRIQWRANNYKDAENGEKIVTGRQSFSIFKKECLRCGVDLTEYEVTKEEGMEINKAIAKPDIRLFDSFRNTRRIIDKACHLDFHKFYMSGLLKARPEFRQVIERIAGKAKTDKKYKTVLAATIGYFHSPACGYKYAQLAKDAINKAYEDYYDVMRELAKERTIIATNTDGIWYQGEEWHGLLESEELGGWSNDHVGCTIRFKSAGSYEFMENGVYTPVVRGRTLLDKLKDRKDWRWGDILLPSAHIECWKFNKGEGIVWQKTNF